MLERKGLIMNQKKLDPDRKRARSKLLLVHRKKQRNA